MAVMITRRHFDIPNLVSKLSQRTLPMYNKNLIYDVNSSSRELFIPHKVFLNMYATCTRKLLIVKSIKNSHMKTLLGIWGGPIHFHPCMRKISLIERFMCSKITPTRAFGECQNGWLSVFGASLLSVITSGCKSANLNKFLLCMINEVKYICLRWNLLSLFFFETSFEY